MTPTNHEPPNGIVFADAQSSINFQAAMNRQKCAFGFTPVVVITGSEHLCGCTSLAQHIVNQNRVLWSKEDSIECWITLAPGSETTWRRTIDIAVADHGYLIIEHQGRRIASATLEAFAATKTWSYRKLHEPAEQHSDVSQFPIIITGLTSRSRLSPDLERRCIHIRLSKPISA
jgi:hypothetical protein